MGEAIEALAELKAVGVQDIATWSGESTGTWAPRSWHKSSLLAQVAVPLSRRSAAKYYAIMPVSDHPPGRRLR